MIPLVAAIGVTGFLAGLAIGFSNVFAMIGFVAASILSAWLLRLWVFQHIEEAYDVGAGYGEATRRRVREIADMRVTRAIDTDRRRGRLVDEDAGASLVEYTLLIVLIAIAALVVVTLFGERIAQIFEEITNQMGGVPPSDPSGTTLLP